MFLCLRDGIRSRDEFHLAQFNLLQRYQHDARVTNSPLRKLMAFGLMLPEGELYWAAALAAIRQGKKNELALILEAEKSYCQWRGVYSNRPPELLIAAVKAGRVDILTMMFHAGFCAKSRDLYLTAATSGQHTVFATLDVCSRLVIFDANAREDFYHDLLELSARGGHTETVHTILRRYLGDKPPPACAFAGAIEGGQLPTLESLVARLGGTPSGFIPCAISRGHLAIANWLASPERIDHVVEDEDDFRKNISLLEGLKLAIEKRKLFRSNYEAIKNLVTAGHLPLLQWWLRTHNLYFLSVARHRELLAIAKQSGHDAMCHYLERLPVSQLV